MITEIRDRKLVVISDLHLGNPFSLAKKPIIAFLQWAAKHRFDVVINGDGFEIAQVSFSKIARDVPEVFHAIKWFTSTQDLNIYYVIGNHDIVLENFLSDWGGFKMAPFLNVWSGTQRIRIEHGHLYDPFFVRSPNLYEFCTWFAGFALKIHPSLYNVWIAFEKLQSRLFRKPSSLTIVGEHPNFSDAAIELSSRGFDHVIFGHTHHSGHAILGNGKSYFNSGTWLIGTPFVEINDGRVTLRKWSRDLMPLTGISTRETNLQAASQSRQAL